MTPTDPPATISDLPERTCTSLLIEGWRGVSHSFSLTSQYYMLELLKLDDVRLFHTDLPFLVKQWNRITNNADFAADKQQQIDAIPLPGTSPIDCVYRISTPIFAGADDDRRRTLTYVVTELGLSAKVFAVGADRYGYFTRGDNLIVTPTCWSQERVIEFGFPADKIRIVPSGVDDAMYYPPSGEERAAWRTNLGIAEDETVFVNVGGSFWNKGVDLLVHAFAMLRRDGRKCRLIVKDQSALYGVGFAAVVDDVSRQHPELFPAETLAGMSVISENLNPTMLRNLYGIADCYVSSYRAEGFNLPVLEAIACGTPVIVTDGGSTDDFCPDGIGWRVPGRRCTRDDVIPGQVARYIEPDLGGLVEAMEGVVLGRHLNRTIFDATRSRIVDAFSWKRASRGLADLAGGRPPSPMGLDAVPVPMQAQSAPSP